MSGIKNIRCTGADAAPAVEDRPNFLAFGRRGNRALSGGVVLYRTKKRLDNEWIWAMSVHGRSMALSGLAEGEADRRDLKSYRTPLDNTKEKTLELTSRDGRLEEVGELARRDESGEFFGVGSEASHLSLGCDG